MAAGDIILSSGTTVTPEDLQKMAAETKKILAAESKELSQYEEVTSLQGITSMPVFHQAGAAYKLVRVAVATLQGTNGREVELQVNAEKTKLEWRYAGGDSWRTLIDLALLKGAPGDTPEFQYGETGLEWKYTTAAGWNTLVPVDDLRFHFDDLTTDQVAALWRELPADVKAEFQAPATEAAAQADAATKRATEAAVLAEQANASVLGQEAARVEAEQDRAAAEAERAQDETDRAAAEAKRAQDETDRAAAEAKRAQDETDRAAAEAKRAQDETDRAQSEATRQQQEAKRQQDTAAAIGRTDTAAGLANDAASRAEAATALTDELNEHPMKPQGGYWYRWNTEAGAYENTGIQAKGDTGSSFRIAGRYDTLDELREAVPDGTDVDGVYAIGAAAPYAYYAWAVVDGTWQWDNQGQLQGPEGKSAYEVWLQDPANEGKPVDDYLAYLRQPATEAATLATEAAGQADSAARKANAASDRAEPLLNYMEALIGHASTATGRAEEAAVHAGQAAGQATEAARAATDAAASIITPDIDHEPGEADTHFRDEAGNPHEFSPGDEARYFDPARGEYVFYKLHDITPDGKAVWKEAGTGGGGGFETAHVTLTCQEEPTEGLLVYISIQHGVTFPEQCFDGTGLTFRIPAGEQYTVSVGSLEGFIQPAPQTFTAEAGAERDITFAYRPNLYGKITFDLKDQTPANITGDVDRNFYRLAARRCHRCVVDSQDEAGVHVRFLDDNDSRRYTNGGDTDTTKPIMVYLPECWVRCLTRESVNERYADVEISGEPQEDGWQHFPQSLVGAFKMGEGGISSYMNGIKYGMSWAEADQACRATGPGWQLVDYRQHCLVALLLYACYGTRDIRSVIGSNKFLPNTYFGTGSTLSKGMNDTKAATLKPDQYTNCLGLEAWTGLVQEWMAGAVVFDGAWYLAGEGGEVREVKAAPATGWVTRMAFEQGGAFDLVPTETAQSGGNTTGWTEFAEVVDAPFHELAVARANFSYGDAPDDGVARLSATLTKSQQGLYYGARAAYYGNIIIEED